jgi:enoyl-CoA hydratase
MDLAETRERIIYEKQGPIAKITLNWPEKANAQDQKLVEEVDAALADADRDYDIKVVILKANGKGFCSGHAIGNNAHDYPEFVVEAADRPLRQAGSEFVGVLQAHNRAGSRLLRRRRHPLRADYRRRDRIR